MDAEYDFSQGKRGAIDPIPAGKTRITIRYIQQQHEPLETTLRRVLREELERVGK